MKRRAAATARDFDMGNKLMDSAPVTDNSRIVSLDVLRGFALLGILLLNVGAFSMPAAAYFNPTVYGELDGVNGLVWHLTHLLADLKFMAIFSMLFGAGIVLMSQRAESHGQKATGLHYRRMFWLIVFGLLHAHLFWYGDILFWYGMCGLIVYLFRRLSPGWLIAIGLLSFSLSSAIMFAGGISMQYWPPEMLASIVAELDPPAEVIAAEVSSYRGGWFEQMEFRTAQAIKMETESFLAWALWRVSGLMMLGMALFKLGVLSAERSARFYVVLIVVALFVGLPLVELGVQYNFANDWAAPGFFFFGLQFNYWASILVALGWIAVVMLLYQRGVAWFTRPLAAVGKMAFTNYILQTVLCTTIFYGHGLGLYGSVARAGQLGIVLAVWALQIIVSPIWLRHFRFGPLEWLWRSLVYLRIQPFRRP